MPPRMAPSKTAEGHAELSHRTRGLSQRYRTVLLLVDGRRTADEVRALCRQADDEGLALVTTEKDQARLAGDAAMAEFATRVQALPVSLVLDEEAAFKALLMDRTKAARRIGR